MDGNMEKLLQYAIDSKASDIHITTNRESTVRIKGIIKRTDIHITKEELFAFCAVYSGCKDQRLTDVALGKKFSLDAALSFNSRRFRLHIYTSINEVCAVLRLLAESVPELMSLNLPTSIGKFTSAKSGLVLICGATGSGKTTTIASIIDRINHTRSESILTIEDPIEYIYSEDMSIIEQREVGTNVESFSQATVDALREDPDIIVVGEMRDLDTIRNAITLAETGHLVFGTLHTKSSIDAIDRMVDIFPPEQQTQIRVQLASILFGIVHQKLIPTRGKMVALCEVLMVDGVIAGTIKQPNKSQLNSIKDYMRNKKEMGCMHVVDNALWHIKSGRLDINDVGTYLSDEDLRMLKSRLGM